MSGINRLNLLRSGSNGFRAAGLPKASATNRAEERTNASSWQRDQPVCQDGAIRLLLGRPGRMSKKVIAP